MSFDSIWHGAPSSKGGQSISGGRASLGIDVASGILYFRTPETGAWEECAGGGGGSGTVTTTGSPITGDLAAFSGATSIMSVTALPNGTTATTQTALDNSIDVATTAYVDTADQNLIQGNTPITGEIDITDSTGNTISTGNGAINLQSSAGSTLVLNDGVGNDQTSLEDADGASAILLGGGQPSSIASKSSSVELIAGGSTATFSTTGVFSAPTLSATAATPTGAVTGVAFGDTTGFGNGSSGTAVTTTTKSTGTGPSTPQTVVGYLEINIGGTVYWVPYCA